MLHLNTSSLSYDSNGYLTQINGPLAGNNDVTTFSFYGYGLPATITNSEGYEISYNYDGLNRLTKQGYPDGSSEQIIYSRLDPVMNSDRQGRWTKREYNSLDQIANHKGGADTTSRYLDVNAERLPEPMERVSRRLLILMHLGADYCLCLSASALG